jgi:hypothetical protein
MRVLVSSKTISGERLGGQHKSTAGWPEGKSSHFRLLTLGGQSRAMFFCLPAVALRASSIKAAALEPKLPP